MPSLFHHWTHHCLCEVCAVMCHEGHDLVEVKDSAAFSCDCGSGGSCRCMSSIARKGEEKERESTTFDAIHKSYFLIVMLHPPSLPPSLHLSLSLSLSVSLTLNPPLSRRASSPHHHRTKRRPPLPPSGCPFPMGHWLRRMGAFPLPCPFTTSSSFQRPASSSREGHR